MNPMLKYTFARLGLFLAASAVMLVLPIELNLFIRLGIALIASAILSFFFLRKLRDDVAEFLASAASRRAERKERLRSALAGDDHE
jgi:hypothetical protein